MLTLGTGFIAVSQLGASFLGTPRGRARWVPAWGIGYGSRWFAGCSSSAACGRCAHWRVELVLVVDRVARNGQSRGPSPPGRGQERIAPRGVGRGHGGGPPPEGCLATIEFQEPRLGVGELEDQPRATVREDSARAPVPHPKKLRTPSMTRPASLRSMFEWSGKVSTCSTTRFVTAMSLHREPLK